MDTWKILIANDDVDFCDSLKAILEQAGQAAVTAQDRPEGMEKMKAERPDLLVLDVMMETWHDGFEMCREFKRNAQFRETPIIMLTSVEERTGVEVRSSAGDPQWLPVERFLDTPVEPGVLFDEIRKLSGSGARV